MNLPQDILSRLRQDGVSADYVAERMQITCASARRLLIEAGAKGLAAGKYAIPKPRKDESMRRLWSSVRVDLSASHKPRLA